jgi:transmembrane sensor
MNRRERSRFNTQIYEEACEWLIECRTSDLDEAARSTLDQWLRKSPEHMSAYLEVAAIWNEGASLDPKRKWDSVTLISQAAQEHANVLMWQTQTPDDAAARADTGASRYGNNAATRDAFSDNYLAEGSFTIEPLRSSSSISLSPALRYLSNPRRWHGRAIAACVAGLGIVVAATWFAAFSAPTYATAIGEQRAIQLPDGSTVELNSYSKLAVHFSRHERDVELMKGQALFQVAKDARRPFVVASGDTTVRAVGTQFDVYMKDSGTIVTVVEGRVAILTDHLNSDSQLAASTDDATNRTVPLTLPAAAPTPATSILLSAGEQLTVTANSARKTEHANVVSATAWTDHQIVFEGASLADVAEEFNRYNRKHLVIDGSRLDTFHISGVFSSTDPGSLLRFLRDRPGLRIVETATEIRIEKIAS